MTPAVEFKSLSKSFHGVRANQDISFKVQRGSIHAVIGENGAGKSTAMNLLYGSFPPDSGDIFIHGKKWAGRSKPWSSPSDAIRAGIGMVHQHFMLGGPLSVLDNIILGFETTPSALKMIPHPLRIVSRSQARKRLSVLSSQFGLNVDLDARVEDLPVGIQQRIEILKLLYREAEILILDEPTAVLTPQETVELFENLRKLCQQGKTVIIITHKLKEVMYGTDRVTVFRGGRVVGERETKDTSVEELASLMVGRKVNLSSEVTSEAKTQEPVLELSGVSFDARRSLKDLTLKVRSGEIVGICGVEGNGQSELIQLILHAKSLSSRYSGKLSILGKDAGQYSTKQFKSFGLGVIPEDRHKEGLMLERSLSENFILGQQKKSPFCKKGLLKAKEIERATNAAIQEFDIRPKLAHAQAGSLSGGNQQKLIIAREFKDSPKFIIAAQPTRGVDIGAVEFIHNRILKARSEGAGVLLISSELDEILNLSDRILVIYEGRFVAEFARGQANESTLGLRMGGASEA